jgi:O-antigen ligase
VMFVAVLAESAVGIAQVGLHSGPSSFARGAVLRGSGTFDQPNPFAGYLNTVLPLAICCLVFRVLPRRWMWLVVAVTAAGILGSLSRGGELGSVAALLTIGLARTKVVKAFLLLAVATGALVAAGLVVGLLPGSLTDPIAQGLGIANVDVVNPNQFDWSTAERLAHMEAGLHMFADHPYIGVGIGNYPAQYPNYRVAPVWNANLGHAHNYYINIAAEAGVVGFAAYILLFGSAMAVCVRTYRRATNDPFGQMLGLGGLAVLVAFSSHQFFDDLLVHGIEVQLALIMAMVTRCALTAPEETPVAASPNLVRTAVRA